MTLPIDAEEGRLADFACRLIASEDIDPVYPVLRGLFALEPERFSGAAGQAGEEARLWLLALYLAYYHVPSALAAFRCQPVPGLPPGAHRWPRATERRGLRAAPALTSHLADYARRTAPRQQAWLTAGWEPGAGASTANYERFWLRAQEVWGNGRWAAFKWAELLKKVLGYPLAAPDMRLKFCSGPRACLEHLYGCPGASTETLDGCGADCWRRLGFRGVPVEDWEALETVLCNYHSALAGRYYVGHDIDELQGQVDKARATGLLTSEDADLLWRARAAALPPGYLGEQQGWRGLRHLSPWGNGHV